MDAVSPAVLEEFGVNLKEDQGDYLYTVKKVENSKNVLVGVLMFRRGILQKRVWHGSMIGLSAFGVLTSGLFGGQTIISSTFPGVGGEDPRFAQTFEPSTDDPVLNSLYDTHTNISKKPRSEVIEYLVKTGDTLSSIADEHDISVDTILWANDLTSKDSIKPGQKVKILPVSGVAHTVKSGDTLESVAKKYAAESQAVLDYPFNESEKPGNDEEEGGQHNFFLGNQDDENGGE